MNKYRAKVTFLWYKEGQMIKEDDIDNVAGWLKSGLIEDLDYKQELDLNKDGKVDKKDTTMAAKILGKIKKKPKRR